VPPEARKAEQILDVSLGGEAAIDEPVASGGDSTSWTGGNDDDDDDEPR
jgi:hypothetical protein